jgi:subtilisin family serine protease
MRIAASNRGPLDLIERYFIACPIVKLSGARTFVRRHGLGVFERPAGFKIGGDAGCPEGVAADLDLEAEVGGAALDHAPGIDPVHRRGRERAGAADGRAEQGGLLLVTEPYAGNAKGPVGLLKTLMEMTTESHCEEVHVVVALIDGPVALGHPALAVETTRVHGGPVGSACSQPERVACAHGTYVAGILHAKRNNQMRGICPGCTLLVRPIFSEMKAVLEVDGVPSAGVQELASALYDVIEAGARVINLSVGLSEPSLYAEPAIDQALEQATRRGAIVVAAAGNQGMLGSSAITRHPWVIPVVACDRNGNALAQSNLGASVGRNGLMAPGRDITSLAASGATRRGAAHEPACPLYCAHLPSPHRRGRGERAAAGPQASRSAAGRRG